MNYEKFLKNKSWSFSGVGIDPGPIHEKLFDFQKDIVRFALRKGRAAIFADCGLGKTFMQLEWARQVSQNGPVLILAPLTVSVQTANEAKAIGLHINICESQSEVKPGINITNYEKLHKFDASVFAGVVLDESSILKSFTGKIRTSIINSFSKTKFKLACTATPSPNDFMELGNHTEFLGVMKRSEMLSMFFVHDGERTSQWRLKGHAEEPFWKWVCSWAVYVQNPSDLGYDGKAFILPELKIHEHIVKTAKAPAGQLFPIEANTLSERREARKCSIGDRAELANSIMSKPDQWLIWCNLNDEADKMEAFGGEQVSGSTPEHFRETILMGFSKGNVRTLITKPKIGGWGMNWQNCNKMIFLGLSDSFEEFYQAVRRCWRFGQKKQVDVHIVISDAERSVLKNIERKRQDFQKMADEMTKHTKDILRQELSGSRRNETEYSPNKKMQIPNFMGAI